MQDIATERLLLHVKSFEEMKQGMLSGDEMCMDFYHAYKYHKENAPGYDLEWFRLWDFYLKDSNTIIGGACFKGQPNEKGEVDIGTKKLLPITLMFDHRIGAFNDVMPFIKKLDEIFQNPQIMREW